MDRSSRGLAEQQNPQGSQYLAEQERHPARPSFSTLREVYKQYYLQDSEDSRDQDVAAYVQALELERESALKRVKALKIDYDSVLEQFQSLRSSVKAMIKKKDPNSSAEDWENVSAYIGRVLDHVHEQHTHIKEKETAIRELNEKSQNQKNFYEGQITAQREAHEKKQKDVEEGHNGELRKKDVDHVDAVARLEDAHQAAVARLNDTIATLQSELFIPGTHFQPLTDSECKSRLGLIRTRVHSLARSYRLNDGHAYGDLFNQAEFVRSTEGKDYMYVVDASIWKVLFNGVFSSPFRVFGQHGEMFTASWEQLFGTGKSTLLSLHNL